MIGPSGTARSITGGGTGASANWRNDATRIWDDPFDHSSQPANTNPQETEAENA